MNNIISIILRRRDTGRQVLKYNLGRRRAEILISVLGLAISPRKKALPSSAETHFDISPFADEKFKRGPWKYPLKHPSRVAAEFLASEEEAERTSLFS